MGRCKNTKHYIEDNVSKIVFIRDIA